MAKTSALSKIIRITYKHENMKRLPLVKNRSNYPGQMDPSSGKDAHQQAWQSEFHPCNSHGRGGKKASQVAFQAINTFLCKVPIKSWRIHPLYYELYFKVNSHRCWQVLLSTELVNKCEGILKLYIICFLLWCKRKVTSMEKSLT